MRNTYSSSSVLLEIAKEQAAECWFPFLIFSSFHLLSPKIYLHFTLPLFSVEDEFIISLEHEKKIFVDVPP